MGNSVKVSVLVPSLNVRDYIERCLDSIVNQTLQEIEVLCIDSGSTDGTIEVIEDYCRRDSRFRLIHSDVRSYGHQMNLGLDAASGEYIGLVETDDFVDSTMFTELYKVACAWDPRPDVVKGNYWEYREDAEGKASLNEGSLAIEKFPEQPFTALDAPKILAHHPCIWAAIYRREFLVENQIRFVEPKGAAWADNPFHFMVLTRAESIVKVNVPLYFYRQDVPGSSSELKDTMVPMKRMLEIFEYIDQQKITDVSILYELYYRIFGYTDLVIGSKYCTSESLDLVRDVYKLINPMIISILPLNDHQRQLYRQFTAPERSSKSRSRNRKTYGGRIKRKLKRILKRIIS